MSSQLTITLPSDLMTWLAASAERDYRTPAAQATWLISEAQVAERNYRARRPPHTRAEAAKLLTSELQQLYLHSGSPSCRGLSARIRESGGRASHSIVSVAISGARVPSWPVLEAIVRILDGDVSRFRALWADVQTAT